MSSAVNPNPSRTDDRTRRNANVGATGTGAAAAGGHHELVARQKEQFGGMKFGCSFFGWLTATGTAVLLTGLLAAVATAFGMKGIFNTATDAQNLRTVGLVSGIVLLIVVLIAYVAGGYVAARMARFSGLKQGLGVWLWAVIFAVVLGVIGFFAGNTSALMSRVSGLRLPVSTGTLTGGTIVTVVAIALIALVGAMLGGLAGMRYHRRVDRAGFDEV
ncbi:hypothetical protein [uncultured Friedmanniella sp.]|uniref:hypothetical protein n=1 Tax=uncultured Friedmanniella sp. TaxID=335381 RepID=UPI0035CB4042